METTWTLGLTCKPIYHHPVAAPVFAGVGFTSRLTTRSCAYCTLRVIAHEFPIDSEPTKHHQPRDSRILAQCSTLGPIGGS